jgi:hypothetical protein
LTSSVREETGVNVLKAHLRTTISTLLAKGSTQREVERVTGLGLIARRCSAPASPAVESEPLTNRLDVTCAELEGLPEVQVGQAGNDRQGFQTDETTDMTDQTRRSMD